MISMSVRPFTERASIILLCIIFLTGCSAPAVKNFSNNSLSRSPAALQQPARLAVFLQLRQSSAPAVTITLSSVEILAGDSWVPLTSRPVRIDAAQIGAGQMFVAAHGVPVGTIERLRFVVEKASIVKGGMEIPLTSTEPVIEMILPTDLDIGKGDSETLFVTWDVLASLQGTTSLTPVMSAVQQAVRLTTDLAYVACPGINTVYVVRTDKNWVVGSFGIQGNPIYLAVDGSQDRLYVLTGNDGDIKVIETTSNKLIDRFKIPLLYDPSFMVMSPDGLWAYIVEKRSEYIYKVDLRSGSLADRVHLGVETSYVNYLDEQQQLAISSALANKVLLVDPQNLAILGEITVGNAPEGVAVWEGQLYIAESRARKVTVYDLNRGVVRNRINVGLTPKRILATANRIFVVNYGDKTISVVQPGQFAAYKEIPLGGTPLEMAVAKNQRWLYVGEKESMGLRIVDPTSGQVAGFIELGAVPLGLSVLQ
jgi:DNA-binding beta-propeller fold protein YncE